MAARKKDPTEPIHLKASRYPGVDEGTSCTQSSFKAGKQAFLYIGAQGGRSKAMFKLQKSMSAAVKLAAKEPDNFQVGKTAWVTARFDADTPLPKKLWEAWLDESYALSAKATAPAKKKGAAKQAAPKSARRTKRK
jgi:hypothetical protein